MARSSRLQDIQLLDAGVTQMNYLPDFGRVEGRVKVLFRVAPKSALETAVVITSVENRMGESLADLRQRLAEDAVRLWAMTLKHTTQKREPYHLPLVA